MNDADRGKIRNPKYAGQLKDFSGLRFGQITPTDIDGFCDFQNKAFILLELKYGHAEIMRGQRLGYERLALACESAGIRTIVILAHHNVPPTEVIPVADLQVSKIYVDGKWRDQHGVRTVRRAFEDFLSWVNSGCNPATQAKEPTE